MPDLPDDTLSIAGDVHRTQVEVESLTARMTALDKSMATIMSASDSVADLPKRLESLGNLVSDQANAIARIKRDLSTMANNMTNMVAASERKILAALAASPHAAGSISIMAEEPPTEVKTTGEPLRVDTSVSEQKPVGMTKGGPKKRVAIPDW